MRVLLQCSLWRFHYIFLALKLKLASFVGKTILHVCQVLGKLGLVRDSCSFPKPCPHKSPDLGAAVEVGTAIISRNAAMELKQLTAKTAMLNLNNGIPYKIRGQSL